MLRRLQSFWENFESAFSMVLSTLSSIKRLSMPLALGAELVTNLGRWLPVIVIEAMLRKGNVERICALP